MSKQINQLLVCLFLYFSFQAFAQEKKTRRTNDILEQGDILARLSEPSDYLNSRVVIGVGGGIYGLSTNISYESSAMGAWFYPLFSAEYIESKNTKKDSTHSLFQGELALSASFTKLLLASLQFGAGVDHMHASRGFSQFRSIRIQFRLKLAKSIYLQISRRHFVYDASWQKNSSNHHLEKIQILDLMSFVKFI